MRKFGSFVLCLNLIPVLSLSGCSSEDIVEVVGQSNNERVVVYKMRLSGFYKGYDDETRASNDWENGAKVFLRFFDEKNGIVTGIATYQEESELWDIYASKALTITESGESKCEAVYFANPLNSTETAISLSPESVIYTDTAATYMLYDDMLTVHAMMMPKTGRIRFKGTSGQDFTLSGLSYYSEYNIVNNTYNAKAFKISSKVSEDGYSSFYHMFFADESNKVMLFDYTANASFMSTFPAEMLQAGTSGFVTIPTFDNMSYWTLVNKNTLEEIEFPVLAKVEAASVRSSSAILRSTISSFGNGTILDAGFIYSKSADISLANGTKMSCGTSANLELRLKELSPATVYYALAYAINEKGTAYSDVMQFTTISKEEDDSSITKDEFDDDDNLNNSSDGDGNFDTAGFGDDDNLNEDLSSSGSVNKEEFGDDDNLNEDLSSSGSVNKEEFNDDDNLNE